MQTPEWVPTVVALRLKRLAIDVGASGHRQFEEGSDQNQNGRGCLNFHSPLPSWYGVISVETQVSFNKTCKGVRIRETDKSGSLFTLEVVNGQ